MSNKPAVLITILLAFALVACGQVSMTDEEHFERAVELERSGELRAAMIELRNVLQQNPQHVGARLGLGRLSLETGAPDAAISEFERARQLGAEPGPLAILMARARLMQGRNEAALEVINETPEADPETQATLDSLRGEALFALGRVDEAGQAFDRVLETHPDAVPALTGAARIALLGGQVGEARAQLDRALALDPASVNAWDLLGDLEQSAGHLDAAEAAYSESIRHSHAPYLDHLKRASVRLVREDFAGAEDDARRMRRLAPNHPATGYVEGLIHFHQGRYPEAQSALEQSLQRGPDFMPSAYYLGATHFAQGHYRRAEQQLSRYLRAFPDSPDGARLLAAIRLREGEPDRAEELLAPLLRRSPDDLMALNLMGNLHLSRGQREEGIAHLRRAADVRPDDADQQAALAMALLRGGDADEGMRMLSSMIDQQSDEMVAQLEMTMVLRLLQERRFDEALEAIAQLREKYPDSALPPTLKAAALAGKGDEAGEREALDEAQRLDPGFPTAALRLGLMARQQGDSAEARRIYRESLEHHPGSLVVLMQLADLEMSEGEIESMRRLLEQAIEHHPEAIAPRIVLGRYYLDTGAPRRTLGLLEPLSGTRDGENIQVLELLARAQLASDRPQQAVTTLRKLSERVPETAEARYRIGQAFIQAQQRSDARTQLESALAIDANHAGALQLMARLEATEQHYDEALEMVRRLQRTDPGNPDAHSLEGDIHSARGDHRAALHAWREAYALSPDMTLAVRVGTAYRRVGQPADAIAFLSERLAEHPDEEAVRFIRAETRLTSGEAEGAIEDYELLLENHPQDVIILNNLAVLHLERDADRALMLAERAHGLVPDNAAIKDTLGWTLVRRGETGRGLELLTQARERLPEHPTIRYHYAYALAETGSRADARRELAALLDESGEFDERSEAEALLQRLR